MVDVSTRNLSTTVLGEKIAFPIGVSPAAFQGLVHSDGEVATARACAELGTLMIAATTANFSLEEVAKCAPGSPRWYQMYIYRDREVTRSMVRRAENNDYKALVLTVDRPVFTLRPSEQKDTFMETRNCRLPNYQQEDHVSMRDHIKTLFDPSLTWNDLKWLCTITRLPVVVKGILTSEDAELALEHGASAILVSNHGGRQLDSVPATIEALPEVVKAVNKRCEVYLDGGVRTGLDVLKALALGARAVFVGRPALWGLAHSGDEGVKEVLKILRNDLDVSMANAGRRNIEELQDLNVVVPHKFYEELHVN